MPQRDYTIDQLVRPKPSADQPARPAPKPAAAPAPEAEEARTKLHEEPLDAILILGEMIRDSHIILDELTGLAFTNTGSYRTNLRLIRSASTRMVKRASRLIGDE